MIIVREERSLPLTRLSLYLLSFFSLFQEMITKAKWLDVILYSKEQVDLENEALGEEFDLNSPWGIVSVKVSKEKTHNEQLTNITSIHFSSHSLSPPPLLLLLPSQAQDEDHELPMNPITIMRNGLGKSEGGSGVPIDRIKYSESVEFWSKHAVVK